MTSSRYARPSSSSLRPLVFLTLPLYHSLSLSLIHSLSRDTTKRLSIYLFLPDRLLLSPSLSFFYTSALFHSFTRTHAYATICNDLLTTHKIPLFCSIALASIEFSRPVDVPESHYRAIRRLHDSLNEQCLYYYTSFLLTFPSSSFPVGL